MSLRLILEKKAKSDLEYWFKTDGKRFDKCEAIINEIQITPFNGLGKPEPLRHDLSGCWSRRLDKFNRIVYRVEGECVYILQCRYHY